MNQFLPFKDLSEKQKEWARLKFKNYRMHNYVYEISSGGWIKSRKTFIRIQTQDLTNKKDLIN